MIILSVLYMYVAHNTSKWRLYVLNALLPQCIPAGYPFTTPGSRETTVDKLPCLGAYTPSGIRTHNPLIMSQEHKPIHHSAPITIL